MPKTIVGEIEIDPTNNLLKIISYIKIEELIKL
jgi:hypothetical protein